MENVGEEVDFEIYAKDVGFYSIAYRKSLKVFEEKSKWMKKSILVKASY